MPEVPGTVLKNLNLALLEAVPEFSVVAHKDDPVYLRGSYQEQVNGQIQVTYAEHGRYEELADQKYTDPGAIFDIMSVTVIDHHLVSVG